jgi:aminoglycoside phosphotransferase
VGITTYPSLVYGSRYPAIPHLHGSTFTDGDVVLSEAETLAVLRRPFTASEKLDGLNVGLSFQGRVPVVHSRVHGVLPLARLGPGLWPLVDFVFDHLGALWQLLGDRYAVFGEWLEGAPSRLPYPRRDVPFVGFDLVDLTKKRFLGPQRSHQRLVAHGFAAPVPVYEGTASSVESLWPLTRRSRFGGPTEGLVLVQGARCFKLVRADYLERDVRPPRVLRPPRPTRFDTKTLVTKTFEDSLRLEVEADRLRAAAAVGPGLVRRSSDRLVMHRLPGLTPRGRLRPDTAAAIGASLATLHSKPSRLRLDVLEPTPSAHLRRALDVLREATDREARAWVKATEKALVPLLRALERGLSAQPVVCHGDLKRGHVRVDPRGAVRFLDFERALVADAAWEVGAAFERLELDAKARVALTQAMGADDGTRLLRAWLYRLAWWVVHPAVLRHERRDASTERFLRTGEDRAKALLEALTGARLPRLRRAPRP